MTFSVWPYILCQIVILISQFLGKSAFQVQQPVFLKKSITVREKHLREIVKSSYRRILNYWWELPYSTVVKFETTSVT